MERDGGVLTIVPHGRLEGGNSVALDYYLRHRFGEGQGGVILDLGKVEALDSSVLRAVLMAAMRLRREGRGFAICSPQEKVRGTFRVSGLDQTLPLYSDLEAARAGLGTGTA